MTNRNLLDLRAFDRLVGALYLDGDLVGFLRTQIVQPSRGRKIFGRRSEGEARLVWEAHIIGRQWSDGGFFDEAELSELVAGTIGQLGASYLIEWLEPPTSVEVSRRYFGGE